MKKKTISGKKKSTGPVAVLRDGTELRIGDDVTTDIYSKCIGHTFVVEEINPYEFCESGTMIIVHLKSDPERKMLGFKKEGWVKPGPDGIDANWFKKVEDVTKDRRKNS